MDWGYSEVPSELESVAILTGRSWAKTAVQRHSRKDRKSNRGCIDLPIDAHLFAFGCKSSLSTHQKMDFKAYIGLKNSFSDRYPNWLVYEKLFFILGLKPINSAHVIPFTPTYLHRGGHFADPSLVSKQGHRLSRGNHYFL
jgi:hypothetical protein